MEVVVVESPAKARTVRKALGSGFRVLACYGHVRDLPPKPGSVRPDEGFAMVYAETGKRARGALGAIRAALAQADALVLATDPDREGEAIAWQVLSWLRERRALGTREVRRVVFHEVTPGAIREAMARPRAVDMDLVRAQQARRALDYLVGYGLSPVLWRKVPGCRSAGRVQSVALRLVCAREVEIEAFAPRIFWSVEAQATAGTRTFSARPVRLDGTPLDPLALTTLREASEAARRIREATFTVSSVERRTVRRKPAPAFTTASLQQEAARRLGLSVKRTMEIAQALYEGVDLGGEHAGLITYMRTDSVAMSKVALADARRIVRREFGAAYLSRRLRTFRSRARFAQEAHEAIRPTDLRRTPESLAGVLGREARALYALIRNRTMASQMAEARFDRVEVELVSADGNVVLVATGSKLAFEGCLRAWRDGAGDAAAEDAALPVLDPGETIEIVDVRVERHVTAPPARYTEAGLVRRLEELGIGRPSTWAAIVGVLEHRQYVAQAGGYFVALERGRVVTAFLEGFFGSWVDYGFTAGLEADLDRIAGGRTVWKEMLSGFWSGFEPALEAVGSLERPSVVAAIEEALSGYIYGRGEDARRCPACREGELEVKASRYGLFVGCARWPACDYRRRLAAGADGGAHEGPRALGSDPVSGLAVTLRRGPHGFYVQRGDGAGGARARRMSVPKAMAGDDIGLDAALALLSLPREVGIHPESGEPVLAGIGRYGPWVRNVATYASLADDDDVLTVGLNRAVALLADKVVRVSRSRGHKRTLRELGPHPEDGAPVWLKTGHYGPFVAYRRSYASVPAEMETAAVTLEVALALLGQGAGGGGEGR